MLKSLTITNFRCFPKYHMPGLARVNLLVGKNNSGKTAVLEAVHFLVEGGDPRILELAAFRRGEMRPRDAQNQREVANLSLMFFQRRVSLNSKIEIFDEASDYCASLRVELYDPDSKKRISYPPDFVPLLAIEVCAKPKLRQSFQYALDGDGYAGYSMGIARAYWDDNPPTDEDASATNCLYLASGLLGSATLGYLWRELLKRRKEKSVLDSLNIIDTSLEDVVFVGSFGGFRDLGRDGIWAGTKLTRNRFPLGSMGEGVWRMFSIGAGLAYCEGGTLLIDEIDSGLHYSLFEDFWAYVVRMAVDLNVQVFATTHSNDCLQALGSLCEKMPELAGEVAVHKLNAGFEVSVPIGGEKLPAVLSGGAEIR